MTDSQEYIKKLEKYIIDLENQLEKLKISIESPSDKNIIWKIRNFKTGLWSGGGTPLILGKNIKDHGKWNSSGKVWKQRGALTNHIRQHTYGAVPSHLRGTHEDSDLLPYVYEWEVVSFSTFEGVPLPANEWWFGFLSKKVT